MTEPKWKSNPALAEKLKPFLGDRSREAWEYHIQQERSKKAIEFLEHYGISPDDPDAGWKAFAALAMEHVDGFQVHSPSGKKAQKIAEDAILLASIELAKEKDANPNITGIIRDLARNNGWPMDDASLETRRRRYYALTDKASPERQQLAIALRNIPEKLWKTSK